MVWLAWTAERAAFELSEFAQRQFGALDLEKNGARFGQKRAAGFGQYDAAADAIEQPGVVARL